MAGIKIENLTKQELAEFIKEREKVMAWARAKILHDVAYFKATETARHELNALKKERKRRKEVKK